MNEIYYCKVARFTKKDVKLILDADQKMLSFFIAF